MIISIEQLQEMADEANRVYTRLHRRRESVRQRIMARARREIDKAISAKFDLVVKTAGLVMQETEKRLNDAKVAASLEAGSFNGYPIGCVLYEWIIGGWKDPKMTGNVAIVEVWSESSKRPGNQRWHPRPGSIVLRFLKKDRTPSSRYEHRPYEGAWLPEGVCPPCCDSPEDDGEGSCLNCGKQRPRWELP